MGEANRRGSYESRKAEGEIKREAEQKKREEYREKLLKQYQSLSAEKKKKLLELIAVGYMCNDISDLL